MDNPTPGQFSQFLLGTWGETRFLELRLNQRLVAIAVTDLMEDGLSAVYCFYDPTLSERSLGHASILRQIEATRDMGLPYLYLGYWIGASRKMAYKGDYRPLEAWRGGYWEALPNNLS